MMLLREVNRFQFFSGKVVRKEVDLKFKEGH